MKHCNSCNKSKPLHEFGVRAASNDGLSPKCRDCAKAYDRGRALLPHRVEARLNYASSKSGKISGGEAKKAWTKRNPIKRAATCIVGNAVRDGRIAKPVECEVCGNTPKRLHGHHDDYAYPMTVRWLCPGCHTDWHKKNGAGLNGE